MGATSGKVSLRALNAYPVVHGFLVNGYLRTGECRIKERANCNANVIRPEISLPIDRCVASGTKMIRQFSSLLAIANKDRFLP